MATWDNNNEETSFEEEPHDVSKVGLMGICTELDKANNLPSYDELFEAFIECHNDLKKIRIKNVSLRKQNVELSNENESSNAKVECLELENESLHGEIMSYKESIVFKHERLHIDFEKGK